MANPVRDFIPRTGVEFADGSIIPTCDEPSSVRTEGHCGWFWSRLAVGLDVGTSLKNESLFVHIPKCHTMELISGSNKLAIGIE